MRGFLMKTSVALLVALVLHVFAAGFADGHLDDQYLRFTSPPQGSLILGTSRAAQGLRPAILGPLLCGPGRHPPLFNYAFTVDHSPYGPTYLRAIEAKVDPLVRDGIFLVTVDPWSLSDVVEDGTVRPWPEANLSLGRQHRFSASPNYEYLLRHTLAGWGSFIGGPLHDIDTLSTLHADGWLQVNHPLDSATVGNLTRAKVRHYRTVMLPKYRPSPERLAWLEKTIRFLKAHGKVHLVRIPAGRGILDTEQALWPDFGQAMQRVAAATEVPYRDMTGESRRYTYLDGNHLDTVSARTFSGDLARLLAPSDPQAH